MNNRKFNDQELVRRNKLFNLKKNNSDPFEICDFRRNYNSCSFKNKYIDLTKEQLHEIKDEVKIAGRILAIRKTFGLIKDFFGKVQFYVNKKENPQLFLQFSSLDIGDIIGIFATPMKTNTGELTLNVKKIILLSKSLKPLPEKWHGLSDEEMKIRQRYVDLIMNDDSMARFILRSKIISFIRQFMSENKWYEVETPILQSTLGGAAAKPFITHHNVLDRQYYLRIATELPLKMLIVGGFEKVFELGRVFRNEGMDATHNPEFTSMEAYCAYSSLEDMFNFAEELIRYVAKKINSERLVYKDIEIDFNKKFTKKRMVDVIKESCGIDFDKIQDDNQAIELSKKHNIDLLQHEMNRGHIIAKFFEKYGEQNCQQPTFVYEYPIEVSPLAKKVKDNPKFTQRFELFICGKELANAFSELNDPIDQFDRFENQLNEKKLGNNEANEMDMDYISALEYGLPPTGGIGFGIDRLIMLFSNSDNIRDVLLFPHTRKKNN